MPPLPRAPLLLFAAFAFAAIGAEACGSSAPNDPAGGDSAPDGSSSGEDAANGPGRSDGSAADAGRGEDGSANDASHEGSVDAGSFGKYVGDDPCVTGASRAAAWTTQGRCSSCPARSPIVSSQTGTIAYSQTISSQGNAALGEPTFASDGTAYVSDKLLSALTPTTLVPKWTHGDYFRSPVVGPDGTLYVSATSPFHEITALDPTTGALKWKRNDFQEYLQRPTILANGGVALLLHASGTKIVVLDPVTGANSWSVALPDTGGEGSLVASVDGTIYATTEASGIFAVSSSTHAVLWNVPVTVREFALDERAQRLYFVAAGGGDKLKVGWMATSGSAPVFGAPFAVTAFSSLHPVELSAI